MTTFIQVEQSLSHPGVERAEAVIERVRAARRGFDGARGLAALLLAAIVSSMLVVADRLMSTTEEGGLMLAWVVLWGVAFFGIALFAGTARSLAAGFVTGARSASRRRAARRADERFMAFAKNDPRILDELRIIAAHQQPAEVELPQPAQARSLAHVAKRSADVRIPSLYEAMRRVNRGQYY